MAGASDQPEPKPEELTELVIPETAPAASPGNETIGSLLGDRYRPIARLGAGAFGEVYRCHDSDLGRDVAVKRIRLEAFVEPAQLEALEKMTRKAGRK